MSDVNMHTCEKQPLGRLRAVELPCYECQREANAREFSETMESRFRALRATPERMADLERQLADANDKYQGALMRIDGLNVQLADAQKDTEHLGTLRAAIDLLITRNQLDWNCMMNAVHDAARAALAGKGEAKQ